MIEFVKPYLHYHPGDRVDVCKVAADRMVASGIARRVDDESFADDGPENKTMTASDVSRKRAKRKRNADA